MVKRKECDTRSTNFFPPLRDCICQQKLKVFSHLGVNLLKFYIISKTIHIKKKCLFIVFYYFSEQNYIFYNYRHIAKTLCRLAAMCEPRYFVTLHKLFLIMFNEQKMNIKNQGDIKTDIHHISYFQVRRNIRTLFTFYTYCIRQSLKN